MFSAVEPPIGGCGGLSLGPIGSRRFRSRTVSWLGRTACAVTASSPAAFSETPSPTCASASLVVVATATAPANTGRLFSSSVRDLSSSTASATADVEKLSSAYAPIVRSPRLEMIAPGPTITWAELVLVTTVTAAAAAIGLSTDPVDGSSWIGPIAIGVAGFCEAGGGPAPTAVSTFDEFVRLTDRASISTDSSPRTVPFTVTVAVECTCETATPAEMPMFADANARDGALAADLELVLDLRADGDVAALDQRAGTDRGAWPWTWPGRS